MNSLFTRWGIWALPVAGIPIFLAWFGFLGAPSVSGDPDAYARHITSPVFIGASYLTMVGYLCLLFGLFAFYTSLPQVSGWLLTAGMVLSLASVALFLPVLGITTLAQPVNGDIYLAGHKDIGEAGAPVAGGPLSGRIITYIVVHLLVGALGAIATGIALWRSRVLPTFVIVLLEVGLVLTIASAPLVTHAGAILLVIAGVWIARRVAAQPVSRLGMASAQAAP